MAKTRQQKEVLVKEYEELISKSEAIIFFEPNLLTVNESNKLRKDIGDKNGHMMLVKNKLFKLALTNSKFEMPKANEKGMNMVIFSFNDPTIAAKHIFELAKEGKSNLRTSFLGEKLIEISQVEELAKLPSLDEMRAKLVGTINAPLSGFVNVLAGNIRGFMNVLTQIAEK